MDAFSIIRWPTLVTCLVLPGLLVYLGLHIVKREIIFVDLALAQVAALGICVSLLLGHEAGDWQSYGWALGFTLVGAALFTLTRTQNHRVPQEALIGIVYVVAAAAGILLLNKTDHGAEELQGTLVGDVLTVQPHDLPRTVLAFVAVAVVHFIFRKRFLAISFNPEQLVKSAAARWWDFLFYALFGLVVTSFVRVAGVLMIFSYLIVPAVCASFLAESLGLRLVIGWGIAAMASLVGLYGSCLPQIDSPPGPAIVCALGIALIFAGVVRAVRNWMGKRKNAG